MTGRRRYFGQPTAGSQYCLEPFPRVSSFKIGYVTLGSVRVRQPAHYLDGKRDRLGNDIRSLTPSLLVMGQLRFLAILPHNARGDRKSSVGSSDSCSGSLSEPLRGLFSNKRPRGTLSRAGASSAHLTGQVHQFGNAVSSAPIGGIRSRGERSSSYFIEPSLAISSLHEFPLSGGFWGVLVGVLSTVLAVVLG